MYQISVPIMNKNFKRSDREKAVAYFKAMGVHRVFLAMDIYENDENQRRKALDELKDNAAYLKMEGFEVGVWSWSFWMKDASGYTRIKRTSGAETTFVCPSDPAFRAFAAGYIKDFARCGIDIILYDDDYRYGYFDDEQGCLCENHVRYMEELLGEKLPENYIKDKLLSGGRNKYRSAWLTANRHYLLEFAREMRKSVDEVNPDIRFGLCSCMSTWDYDGATAMEIAQILAGRTKPLLRLSGAPYWAVHKAWGNRLQDVIEISRMELAWITGPDMEVISEGDVYPRPRFVCPASYLEGFDTALRAAGGFDGILKYAFDYTSTMKYETGYVKRHLANLGLYEEIEAAFGNKNAIGVRVYESMKKFEDMEVPLCAEGENIADMFFSPAARMLAACSIPTVYEGEGICGIAFGENAKYLPQEALSSGLILDVRAAEILMEQGIDVGIKAKKKEIEVSEEHFAEEDEYLPFYRPHGIYELELRENAAVQSWFVGADLRYPASYLYENEQGQRFFVLCFEGYFMPEPMYRQYTRSRQLANNVRWLSGRLLPAYISGNPDLYVMTKSDGQALSVGLWNFHADFVEEPVVELDKTYTQIRFINCSGRLEGNKVFLFRLDAFGFAAFEVQ